MDCIDVIENISNSLILNQMFEDKALTPFQNKYS
jgi:hypothetical protein